MHMHILQHSTEHFYVKILDLCKIRTLLIHCIQFPLRLDGPSRLGLSWIIEETRYKTYDHVGYS